MGQWNNDRWSRASAVIFLGTPQATSEDKEAYRAMHAFLGKYRFSPRKALTKQVLRDVKDISDIFKEVASQTSNQTLFLCMSEEEVRPKLLGLKLRKVRSSRAVALVDVELRCESNSRYRTPTCSSQI